MKIVCASDSFKGSLSSEKIGEIVGRAAQEAFSACDYHQIIMADGGEGTLHAVAAASENVKILSYLVNDPLGRKTPASLAIFPDQNRALIELAEASGLTKLTDAERNPLYTSTFGTGQLILQALTLGMENITIAIGGSATNDGGTGAMEALGVQFLGKSGQVLSGNGINLAKIESISLEKMDERVKNASFTVMCDVKNPLTGTNGATYVFSPQKGATKEDVMLLEEGMLHYERILEKTFPVQSGYPQPSKIIGGGAAGGIGAAFALFLHATMQSGAETILELCHFKELIKDADLVITGEGCLDSQTASGKVISAVASYCKDLQIPCCAIVGTCKEQTTAIRDTGITEILEIKPANCSIEESIKNGEQFYDTTVRKLFADLNVLLSFI